MHVTVLGPEANGFLGIKPNGIYLDATGGGGGHSAEILERLQGKARLIIADRDPSAVEVLEQRFGANPRCRIIRKKFSGLFEILQKEKLLPLDGLLADLGLSSIQLDDPGRSFSFFSSAPLDMRMNPHEDKSLQELLDEVTGGDLADILFRYGEERHSRKMARAIWEARHRRSLSSAAELGALAEKVLGRFYRKMKIHPATRTFQALRIWVNDEIGELSALLEHLPEIIAPGGRVVMISFHSLEDRCVKQKFQALKQEGWRILTKKPVTPAQSERRENPRSRSAKLRAIEKGEEPCREF